jgi:hypothetical protein
MLVFDGSVGKSQDFEKLPNEAQRAQMRWERFTPVLNRWIPPLRVLHSILEFVGTAIDVTEQAQARIEKLPAGARESFATRSIRFRQRGGLNGSSSLENFTKRIDFRTNFLAAVTLSISMKYVKVENNHRGAFRIRARTPPKG